jgi:transposase
MSGWIIPKDVPLAITVIVGDAPPIIIRGQMTNPTARCPQCGTFSERIHSAYWRTVQDLPWRTVPVQWLLRCRRFWCPNPACARTLFCERLPAAWVAARQRRTTAVWTHLTAWGWTASAADVARVATDQGVAVSPDTVIRALRRAPDPPVGALRVVGVDEWALRKGRTYATILVDQEQHRIVDVLPDDRPATVAAWLAAHPTIQVVTRDRDEAFAKAIAAGAPTATQVADRFHLLQNLRQVLERVFHQHGVGPPPGDPTPTAAAADPGRHREPAPTLGAQHRQDRWTQVQALAAAGHSISAIARQLNLDRSTVRKYATAATCPAPPPRADRPRALAGWTGRLEALWQAGEHSGLRLFETLQADGYTGSLSAVHRWLARHHRRPAAPSEAPAPPRTSPATRAWQCLQRPPDWSRPTARALTAALQDPTVRTAYTLAHLFRSLVTYRRPQALEPWLRRAEASGLPAFQHFATSLRRDLAAVTAAVAGPWSQGPTEGFNHKIKRTKRLMYGRAKFDLLRIRILHAPA